MFSVYAPSCPGYDDQIEAVGDFSIHLHIHRKSRSGETLIQLLYPVCLYKTSSVFFLSTAQKYFSFNDK